MAGALGDATTAAHYNGYAAAAIAATRNASGSAAWTQSVGLHAAAEALNGGWVSAPEAALLLPRLFNDLATICSLSAFNTYTILRALAAAGDLDRGYAALHACWDVMLDLGATTTWETSKPGWAALLHVHDGIPGFQDGFASMAHPWASGATQWASQHLAGLAPTAPGFARFAVQPHISGDMRGVRGVQPLPGGDSLSVAAGGAAGSGVCIDAPRAPRTGELRLSEVLVERLLAGGSGATVTGARFVHVFLPGECACSGGGAAAAAAAEGVEEVARGTLAFTAATEGPLRGNGARARVASLALRTGGCNVVTLQSAAGAAPAAAAPPNPFPPLSYPAVTLGADQDTAGDWLGTYGAAGFFLAAFDGPGKHREQLPPWVASVTQVFGPNSAGPWLDPPPANDTRALLDPAAPQGPRKIGQFSAPPPPEAGWAPSFPFDIRVRAPPAPGTVYQFSAYFVDFDFRGRRQSVQLMDGDTLNDIAPVQLLSDFEGGVWLSWQYNSSVRLRINFLRGTNQVLSAILFDVVNTTAGRA